MTRGHVQDLGVPVTLGEQLPEIYQRFDPDAIGFTQALDEVLAPIWSVLDNYGSYFDPFTAPMDFVELMATWIGWPLDRNWSESLTRHLVAEAVGLYPTRGTLHGLSELVTAYTGVRPTIEETGRTQFVEDPTEVVESSAQAAVRIRVPVPEGVVIDIDRLQRLIDANTPAHVRVNIESGGAGSGGGESGGAGSGGDGTDPSAGSPGPAEGELPPPFVGSAGDLHHGPPSTSESDTAHEPPPDPLPPDPEPRTDD